MAISQKKIVDILSAEIGRSAVAIQRFDGRVLTDNKNISPKKVYFFYDPAQVADTFGSTSREAKYARLYFSVILPSPISKADALQFYRHPQTEVTASFVGGNITKTLDKVKASGATVLEYRVDDDEYTQLTVDIASAETFDAIAQEIATELGGTGSYEIAPNGIGRLVISGVNGFTFKGKLANELGLDLGENFHASPAMTLSEVFAETVRERSFGALAYLTTNTLDEIVATAELNKANNITNMFLVDVPYADRIEYSNALSDTGGTSLQLNMFGDDLLSALPAALLGATDYNANIPSTINYMFKEFGVTYQSQVTTDAMHDELTELKINFVGLFKGGDSEFTSYGSAIMCGGQSDPDKMEVFANEMWLKAYAAQKFINAFKALNIIPNNNDGLAITGSILSNVINKAKLNGVISVGKNVDDTKRLAIYAATNDPNAVDEVFNNGYWVDYYIEPITQSNGTSIPQINYNLVYASTEGVRKVVGRHNIV